MDWNQRLVFGIALRIIKDERGAEDFTQIVFVDIVKNAAPFDAQRGTLKIWMLQGRFGVR